LRPALLDALRGYRLADLGRDATAGLVVGVIALPLAIAFAMATLGDAAGNAPQVGLVTVVVAGTLAALAGGSRVLVTGPTGAFIVVLAGVVQRHGVSGLLLATFIAGLLLVLAGLLRLGAVIKFIPYPVTVGFTAGIAVVIFAGQLPDLLGVHLAHASPAALGKAWQVAQAVAAGAADWWSLGVAVATILAIQACKRWLPRVPGPVLALLVLTVAVSAVHAPVATVGDRYTIPRGLPAPSFPHASLADVQAVFPDAVTIALLGAIESLLAAVVADGMLRTRHDSNMELVGQGLANVASPLFGGIAATGAIARTAANVQSGGRTPVAALVHVLVVLAVLFLAAPLAGLIPMPVLAGILAVVAWNMSERHHFARILRMPRADAAVMLATFGLTVLVDLTTAVLVGLVLAGGLFLQRMSAMTQVRPVQSLEHELAVPRFDAKDVPPGAVVYSVDGPFFFGAADQFQEAIGRIGEQPKVVVLRLRNVPYLDATAVHALEAAVRGLQKRGVRVLLASIQSQPLDVLERVGTMRLVGDGNLFRTTPDALAEARRFLGVPDPATPAPPAPSA
jgi:SulP family sulfate permease